MVFHPGHGTVKHLFSVTATTCVLYAGKRLTTVSIEGFCGRCSLNTVYCTCFCGLFCPCITEARAMPTFLAQSQAHLLLDSTRAAPYRNPVCDFHRQDRDRHCRGEEGVLLGNPRVVSLLFADYVCKCCCICVKIIIFHVVKLFR